MNELIRHAQWGGTHTILGLHRPQALKARTLEPCLLLGPPHEVMLHDSNQQARVAMARNCPHRHMLQLDSHESHHLGYASDQPTTGNPLEAQQTQ